MLKQSLLAMTCCAVLGAADEMNKSALGFEPFAKGGKQCIALKDLRIGHSGEGHCHVQWH